MLNLLIFQDKGLDVDGREDFACLEDLGPTAGLHPCHLHPGIYIHDINLFIHLSIYISIYPSIFQYNDIIVDLGFKLSRIILFYCSYLYVKHTHVLCFIHSVGLGHIILQNTGIEQSQWNIALNILSSKVWGV